MDRNELYLEFMLPQHRDTAIIFHDEGLSFLRSISNLDSHEIYYLYKGNLEKSEGDFNQIDFDSNFFGEGISLYILKMEWLDSIADYVESFFIISFDKDKAGVLKLHLGGVMNCERQNEYIDNLLSSTQGRFKDKALEIRDAIVRSSYIDK